MTCRGLASPSAASPVLVHEVQQGLPVSLTIATLFMQIPELLIDTAGDGCCFTGLTISKEKT
jgi:hypothetical protein